MTGVPPNDFETARKVTVAMVSRTRGIVIAAPPARAERLQLCRESSSRHDAGTL